MFTEIARTLRFGRIRMRRNVPNGSERELVNLAEFSQGDELLV